MKTLDFIDYKNSLVLVYTPEAFYNGLIEQYRRDGKIIIKRCFAVTTAVEYSLKEDEYYDVEESLAFKIGVYNGLLRPFARSNRGRKISCVQKT